MSTQESKLMDQIREVMRLGHYSIHIEKSYCDWIRRFIFISWHEITR